GDVLSRRLDGATRAGRHGRDVGRSPRARALTTKPRREHGAAAEAPMQPGWLSEHFHEHVDGESAPGGVETEEAGVSRLDFVKSGVVAGVAAGMVAAQVPGPAQAQQAFSNPLGN